MKVLDKDTKFAHLGKPGEIFSKGFARRLNILKTLVDFRGKSILDLGCGEGVWLNEFAKLTTPQNVYGSEFDPEQIERIHKLLKKATEEDRKKFLFYKIPIDNIRLCHGEALDFRDRYFDIVFQNEVLEHVQDDQKTLDESMRVLEIGGKLIIFTPNRGWPFETHGMFLNGKYYWGNIPLLPWMPKFIYKKFAPHVRNYSNGEIRKKIEKAGGKIIYHKHVFPGFDGMVRKFGIFGKAFAGFFHVIEKTPLPFFGISHLIIADKKAW